MSLAIKILNKQSIIDVAVQQFGNIDAVFDIIRWNKDVGLGLPLRAGTELIAGQSVEFSDRQLPDYYLRKNITPATGTTSFESESNWILNTGFWNDNGIWEDHSNWIDNL